MKSKCRNCQNSKEIYGMFYTKTPIQKENEEIIYGSYTGNYFCDAICWLIFKKIILAREIITEIKCKSKPTCDKCFSKLDIHPLPILYNHKPFCLEVFAETFEKEDKRYKKCSECQVEIKLTFCEKWLESELFNI